MKILDFKGVDNSGIRGQIEFYIEHLKNDVSELIEIKNQCKREKILFSEFNKGMLFTREQTVNHLENLINGVYLNNKRINKKIKDSKLT